MTVTVILKAVCVHARVLQFSSPCRIAKYLNPPRVDLRPAPPTGIANTMDLPERLLPKVHSRLGMGRIVFQPYTKDQISTIVTARLEGLPGEAYDML